MLNERDRLVQSGFEGFMTVRELRESSLSEVPDSAGVYAVLRDSGEPPVFLGRSAGGLFKGRDPTAPVADLAGAWVPEGRLLYVGKAGRSEGAATLRKRLRSYLEFGAGRPVGHWGGRFIWQLADADELVVCWRPTGDEEPRDVERLMLAEFRREHGQLPFANLQK